ncbi:hypothetical protein ACM66B_003429 [Microbotryomycetes sp. NB124-2]
MQGFRKFSSTGHGSVHNSPLKLSLSSLDGVFHRAHGPLTRKTRRRSTTTSSDDEDDSSCQLYTYPKSKSLVPVLTTIEIAWDATCAPQLSQQAQQQSKLVDVLLSVQTQQDGMLPVHLWQGVDGDKLTTQLNPTWWNASTGAGRIAAQFSLIPNGNPIWDTPVAAGPSFVIFYNGSYPSLTNSGPLPAYTGPSVESVGGQKDSHAGGLTGGKLGAAVAVPLLAVAIAVATFLLWSRWRKKPEQKRWSAVVDERMSMVSHGTWQPRASMSSRPGSFHPAASIRSGVSRPFAVVSEGGAGGRPGSTYSANVPSPLGNGASSIRAPAPAAAAEMRQVGENRVSRISFAGLEHHQRPSFSSAQGVVQRPHSMHNRLPPKVADASRHRSAKSSSSSLGVPVSSSKPKMARAESDQTVYHSARSVSGGSSSSSLGSKSSLGGGNSGAEDDLIAAAPLVSRSGTMEELYSQSPTSPGARARQPGGNAYKASIASSLRNDIVGLPAVTAMMREGQHYQQDGSTSPTLSLRGNVPSRLSYTSDSPMPRIPKPSLQLDTTNKKRLSSHMPTMVLSSNEQDDIKSPDEALASYATAATGFGTEQRNEDERQDEEVKASGNSLTRSASQFIAQPAKKWFKSLSLKPFGSRGDGGGHGESFGQQQQQQSTGPVRPISYGAWNREFGETVVVEEKEVDNDEKRGRGLDDRSSVIHDEPLTFIGHEDDDELERAKSPFDDPSPSLAPVVNVARPSYEEGQGRAMSRPSFESTVSMSGRKRSLSVKRQQRKVEQAAKEARDKDPYAEFDQEDDQDSNSDEVGMAL